MTDFPPSWFDCVVTRSAIPSNNAAMPAHIPSYKDIFEAVIGADIGYRDDTTIRVVNGEGVFVAFAVDDACTVHGIGISRPNTDVDFELSMITRASARARRHAEVVKGWEEIAAVKNNSTVIVLYVQQHSADTGYFFVINDDSANLTGTIVDRYYPNYLPSWVRITPDGTAIRKTTEADRVGECIIECSNTPGDDTVRNILRDPKVAEQVIAKLNGMAGCWV